VTAESGARRACFPAALPAAFYDRPVLEVAPQLLGCVLRHGSTSGVIVETEAYHHSEPAAHSFIGVRPHNERLFGGPGMAYVYRSYGIHALVNAVCEAEGVGAAVLIRALAPLDGEGEMVARRRVARELDLCNGPGKLTQALDIGLDLNGTSFAGDGPMTIEPRPPEWQDVRWVAGIRIGITKAADLPWRFCAVGAPTVSKPWPPGLREANLEAAAAMAAAARV
jgi:DNA-3-methyladenine glycosylase